MFILERKYVYIRVWVVFFFLMYICLSAEAEGSVADAALAEGVQSNRGRVQ